MAITNSNTVHSRSYSIDTHVQHAHCNCTACHSCLPIGHGMPTKPMVCPPRQHYVATALCAPFQPLLAPAAGSVWELRPSQTSWPANIFGDTTPAGRLSSPGLQQQLCPTAIHMAAAIQLSIMHAMHRCSHSLPSSVLPGTKQGCPDANGYLVVSEHNKRVGSDKWPRPCR